MLRSRLPALAAAGLMTVTLASCGTVEVPAGPSATDPVCADILLAAPEQVLGMDRVETSSQGTAAWGHGEDAVVMRCGVTPPGPTTDLCTTLEDANGVQVDWVVRELEDDVFLYTTFGRDPAIDVSVPRSAAPDQPSGAALDLAQVVSRNIEATDYCVGPGDEEE
ncbi:DUF3515 domain-containing protein [Brachybacterium alimentarium]|uniref:DUF3515 domain-containing protein n=1 Tax=Brachybacterium alimentarium TaxID=47845 RepID=UPI000DF1DED6|nr:DUF3515 domain-containing protein [Brachybacterium alimentarium]RCS71999.1 DUF3515 domain-containing protein [Brachybacterium alimentarium]RCS75468.1 DUF3515 domain-containing protein [Brachybacterium alimentarium]RCS78319.1 DUF3515 domain-containing protein [Brachybacterium alimentarium]RCS86733.1 DUF3515 domain-containing protein [Brachybacterium alimentarium]RCS90999.1 DUF3515 domain-containing protein [Brachybacterium alimentarium]